MRCGEIECRRCYAKVNADGDTKIKINETNGRKKGGATKMPPIKPQTVSWTTVIWITSAA